MDGCVKRTIILGFRIISPQRRKGAKIRKGPSAPDGPLLYSLTCHSRLIAHCSLLIAHRSSRLGEGSVEDLTQLAAGGAVAGAEVGALLGVAGLAGAAAGVARDQPALPGALDKAEE